MEQAYTPKAHTPCEKGDKRLLTDRELEIATLIVNGKQTKEVAAMLGISELTARTHRGKIMAKLDIHDTWEFFKWGIDAGLVIKVQPLQQMLNPNRIT